MAKYHINVDIYYHYSAVLVYEVYEHEEEGKHYSQVGLIKEVDFPNDFEGWTYLMIAVSILQKQYKCEAKFTNIEEKDIKTCSK